MGVSSPTPSWLQTAERKHHRSRERGAKDAGREWEEGHTNSGKWESRRQADIITAVTSVRQRYSWAHLQNSPLGFVSHTHATWQSVKGTVCLQVCFSGAFLPSPPALNVLQKFRCVWGYCQREVKGFWGEVKYVYREERGALTPWRWLSLSSAGT